MRLPLAIPLDSRNGDLSKDGRLTNALVETFEGNAQVVNRPGLAKIKSGTGQANGAVAFNGEVLSLSGTKIFKGTQTTLIDCSFNGTAGSQTFTNTGTGGTLTSNIGAGGHVLSSLNSVDGKTSLKLAEGDQLDLGTPANFSHTFFSNDYEISFDLFLGQIDNGIDPVDDAWIYFLNTDYSASQFYQWSIRLTQDTEDGRVNGNGYYLIFSLIDNNGTVNVTFKPPAGYLHKPNSWTKYTVKKTGNNFSVKAGEINFKATSLKFVTISGTLIQSLSFNFFDQGLWFSLGSANKVFVKNLKTISGTVTDSGLTVASGKYDFAQSSTTPYKLLMKTASNAYIYNGSTVTAVTDVDYPATTTRGVVYLDGRFFVMSPTGIIYQSAFEDGLTWAALEFIGATLEPDAGVYIAKYQNYIMALKQWSTEFFYDAANATGSILAPVQSMAFKIGCASADSVKETSGTVYWIGKTKDGAGVSVYRMNASSPEKVSSPQVDSILNNDSLTNVSSWTCKIGNHELYGLNLDSISLVFDISTGFWSEFSYLYGAGVSSAVTAISTAGVCTSSDHGFADGEIIKIAGSGDWDGFHVVNYLTTGTFGIQGSGSAFSGSATAERHNEGMFPIKSSVSSGGRQIMQADDSVYSLSVDNNDDIGAIATRIRTVRFDGGTAKRKTFAEAELVGDKTDSFALIRYSDDDYETWSKSRPVDLSLPRSRVRRMGDANRRAFEILHVKNNLVRFEALEIEVN